MFKFTLSSVFCIMAVVFALAMAHLLVGMEINQSWSDEVARFCGLTAIYSGFVGMLAGGLCV